MPPVPMISRHSAMNPANPKPPLLPPSKPSPQTKNPLIHPLFNGCCRGLRSASDELVTHSRRSAIYFGLNPAQSALTYANIRQGGKKKKPRRASLNLTRLALNLTSTADAQPIQLAPNLTSAADAQPIQLAPNLTSTANAQPRRVTCITPRCSTDSACAKSSTPVADV